MEESRGPDFEPETQKWMDDLRAIGPAREEALHLLYADLLRVALFVARNRGWKVAGPELDDLAHQATADAMMNVLTKLEQFRGDSKFTTWAHRFVEFEVAKKMSRHFWQRGSLSLEGGGEALFGGSRIDDPETLSEWRSLEDALRRVVREDLTTRQRSAFEAVVLRGINPGRAGDELGASRNAVYKMLFDARKKIRVRLESEGYLSMNG
jgi:RNA polymerase sigma-70 factor, ECF subfamily